MCDDGTNRIYDYGRQRRSSAFLPPDSVKSGSVSPMRVPCLSRDHCHHICTYPVSRDPSPRPFSSFRANLIVLVLSCEGEKDIPILKPTTFFSF